MSGNIERALKLLRDKAALLIAFASMTFAPQAIASQPYDARLLVSEHLLKNAAQMFEAQRFEEAKKLARRACMLDEAACAQYQEILRKSVRRSKEPVA